MFSSFSFPFSFSCPLFIFALPRRGAQSLIWGFCCSCHFAPLGSFSKSSSESCTPSIACYPRLPPPPFYPDAGGASNPLIPCQNCYRSGRLCRIILCASCRPAQQQLLCYLRVSLLLSEFCITRLRREGPDFYHGICPMYWRKGGTKNFGKYRAVVQYTACGWRLFPHPFTVPQQSSEVLRYGEPIMRDGDIQLSTEAPL